MNILSLSDVELPAIYSPYIKTRFNHINLVIGCGDLRFYYLEFIVSMLDVPLYYVHGNHVQQVSYENGEIRQDPWGAINLHKQVFYDKKYDLILAGIEGSLRYSRGKFQYSSKQMWAMTLGLVPKLLRNRFYRGRYLDIFVTHSAPQNGQQDVDYAHRGVPAFRWLIKVFRPKLHLHGHIHLYNPLVARETQLFSTRIINTFGYQEISWPFPLKN